MAIECNHDLLLLTASQPTIFLSIHVQLLPFTIDILIDLSIRHALFLLFWAALHF